MSCPGVYKPLWPSSRGENSTVDGRRSRWTLVCWLCTVAVPHESCRGAQALGLVLMSSTSACTISLTSSCDPRSGVGSEGGISATHSHNTTSKGPERSPARPQRCLLTAGSCENLRWRQNLHQRQRGASSSAFAEPWNSLLAESPVERGQMRCAGRGSACTLFQICLTRYSPSRQYRGLS